MSLKLSIDKDILQKVFSQLQGIVEKKSTYPVLSHVLLTSKANEIFIEATDLEISIKERIKGEVQEEGTMCLPAKRLFDLIREFPPQTVHLEEKENFWVEVTSGRIKSGIPGIDPKDFPTTSQEGKEEFSFSSSYLQEMIEKTAFAASTQESRFNLNGIFMESIRREDTPYLRFVATDGHRLSLMEREGEVSLRKGIIIPKRGLTELRKLLGKGDITVSVGENHVIFKGEDYLLFVRLLEGEFPDYKHVIPTENEKHILIDRASFIGTLRRAHILAAERGEGVKLSISSGRMEVQAGGADVGYFSEEIMVSYDGEAMDIAFNPRYLLEALNVMKGEEVRLELKDEESAGVLREEGDDSFIYVIMPMRVHS